MTMHYLIFLKGNRRWQMEVSYLVGTKNLANTSDRSLAFSFVTHLQWNLDLTKCQLGTGEVCSFYRGFVISNASI